MSQTYIYIPMNYEQQRYWLSKKAKADEPIYYHAPFPGNPHKKNEVINVSTDVHIYPSKLERNSMTTIEQDLSRTEKLCMAHDISEDEAHLLLTFKYFQMTRVEGVTPTFSQMEDWCSALCAMPRTKVQGLLQLLNVK